MTDSQYFNEMINTSQTINESYGYLWWLNGGNSFHLPSSQLEFPGSIIPNAPDDLYMAIGKNGQFINVVPSQKMVWIRMGNEPTSAPVPYLMNLQIWNYINDLECSIGFNEAEESILKIYPNPTNDRITITSDKVISKLEIIDLKGRIIETNALNTKSIDFSIRTLNDGIYYAKITFDDGIQVVQKIFID
jgi:CubicO group peptidase (beta-lactamase class C family)